MQERLYLTRIRMIRMCFILLPLILIVVFAFIHTSQVVADEASDVATKHVHDDLTIIPNYSVPSPENWYKGSPLLSPFVAQSNTVGQWSQVYNWPLIAIHAVTMESGQILMWDRENDITSSMTIFDPNSLSFTPVANPNASVFCSGFLPTLDGRIVLIGGHDLLDNFGLNQTNIFNISSKTWTRGPDMIQARWYPGIMTLSDGRFLVTGGSIDSNSFANIPEIFDPNTNQWTSLNLAQRQFGYYPKAYQRSDGRVFFVSTGGNQSGILDLNTQTWSGLTTGPDGYFMSSVMYRPGKVMWAGNGPTTQVTDINASAPTWRYTNGMAYSRNSHNLVILPNGKVLAIGGSSDNTNSISSAIFQTEIWDPNTEQWSQLTPMQTPRMYHSIAMLLPDGRVLSAGGGKGGNGPDYPSAEIYSPPYMFQGTRPTIDGAPNKAAYGNAITVQSLNASTISSVVLINAPSVTHGYDFNQRYVPLSFSVNGNNINAQITSNANDLPPGIYMLFILDGNGVPSVAKFIQISSDVGGVTATPSPTQSITPTLVPTSTWTSTPTQTLAFTATPTNSPTPTATLPTGQQSVNVQVNSTWDDVNEVSQVVSESNSSIWVGGAGSSTNSYLGLRFNNLNIPAGATIAGADIQYYSLQQQWINLNVDMAAEASDNAPDFSTIKPSQRVLTAAHVSHSSDVQWLNGTWYSLGAVTPLVQEVINRPGWQTGKSMAFVLRGTGGTWARKFMTSYDGNPAFAPRLIISYVLSGQQLPTPTLTPSPTLVPTTIPTQTFTPSPTFTPSFTFTPLPTITPSFTPLPTLTFTPVPNSGTVVVNITNGSNDVNEVNNALDTSTNGLWIGNAGSTSSYAGLRFTNVAIPAGATITAAQLQFYSTAQQWITINMTIAGEAVPNSIPFSASSRPSQRTLLTPSITHSSNVPWIPNTWYTLSDITPVIQRVITTAGWQTGNPVTLILKGMGGGWGRKFAASFETNSTLAARLIITYNQ